MILGEVEETITSVEIDDETYEEIIKVQHFSSMFALVQQGEHFALGDVLKQLQLR